MAELGFRTVNEMIGQADELKLRNDIDHWKFKHLDLSPVLYKEPAAEGVGLYHYEEQDHLMQDILDWKLLEVAKPALESGTSVKGSFNIINTDRATGTVLSHEVTKNTVPKAFPKAPFISTSRVLPDKVLALFATKELHWNWRAMPTIILAKD